MLHTINAVSTCSFQSAKITIFIVLKIRHHNVLGRIDRQLQLCRKQAEAHFCKI